MKTKNLLFLLTLVQYSPESLTEKTYDAPALYNFHDYDKCFKENDESALYCVVEAIVQPDNSSKAWQIISSFDKPKRQFNHRHLQYGLCKSECFKVFSNYDRFFLDTVLYHGKLLPEELNLLDPTLFSNGLEQRLRESHWTAECINADLYKNYGLTVKSSVNYCVEKDWLYRRDFLYWIFLAICVSSVGFSIFSTWKVLAASQDQNDDQDRSCRYHFLEAFSIENNLKRLVSPSTPGELSFLHTLKFFTMFTIVGGHTILFSNVFPVSNPEYIETNYNRIITMLLINGPTVTQSFFVISGFLIYLELSELDDRSATVSFAMKSIFFRYFKLLPPLVFMVLLHMTWLIEVQDGPMWKFMAETEHSFCRKNWWATIFMLNNYLNPHQPCLQQTWFLSANFHMSVMTLIVILFCKKHPQLLTPIIGAKIFISIIVLTVVFYVNRFDSVFIASPESLRTAMLFDAMYLKLHIPTHSNVGNYLIGVLTGIIYCNMKQRVIQFKPGKKLVVLWYLVVPLGVLNLLSAGIFYRYDFEKPSIWVAVCGSLLKYSWGLLGLIFVVGITNGIGPFVNRYLCNAVFVPLGRLTYCVFLSHTFIIRATLGNLRGPMFVSDTGLLVSCMATFVLSLLMGLLLNIFIESPCSCLLKLFANKFNQKSTKRDKNDVEKNTFNLQP